VGGKGGKKEKGKKKKEGACLGPLTVRNRIAKEKKKVGERREGKKEKKRGRGVPKK